MLTLTLSFNLKNLQIETESAFETPIPLGQYNNMLYWPVLIALSYTFHHMSLTATRRIFNLELFTPK